MVHKQFCDSAIELVHEKKMLELKMTGPAYLFFCQLKREAKLGHCNTDETEQGAMVRAI